MSRREPYGTSPSEATCKRRVLAAAPVIPEQTVEIYSNAATSYAIDLTKN